MRISVKNGGLILLVCVPVLLVFQGIDFTDTGWVLSNYRQIFSDPESVSYWFHLWLPNVIGGLWDILFGGGGLFSFRFAAILIFWLTAFCVYRAYRGFVSSRYLFPALALGMVLHFPSKITVIHYNNVSMLFLTLGAVLLFSGIGKKSRAFIFLSGGAFSLAAFARLPNVLGMAFALALVYDWFMEKGKRRDLIKNTAVFFGGALAAAAGVLVIMRALGHLDLYITAVKDLFFGSKENLSHYGSDTMEKKFFLDWARSIFAACVMLGGFFVTHIAAKKILKKNAEFISLAALAALTFIFTWIKAWSESMIIVYPLAGFITLSCLMIIAFLGNEYKNQKLLALMTILLLGILSVGSDTGMKVAAYALIFGFPLALWYWYELPRTKITLSTFEGDALTRESTINWNPALKKSVISLALVLYIAYSVPFTLRNVYRDSPSRWQMTENVNHPMLRGIFTTPARAAAVQSLLTELEHWARPGDILLTYESIPLLYFLTRTRPYLYNPWPILYLPVEFEKNLEKARAKRLRLPTAVMAKVETRSENWPKSGAPNRSETAKANRNLLRTFLDENRYVKVWENDTFEILVPASSKK